MTKKKPKLDPTQPALWIAFVQADPARFQEALQTSGAELKAEDPELWNTGARCFREFVIRTLKHADCPDEMVEFATASMSEWGLDA